MRTWPKLSRIVMSLGRLMPPTKRTCVSIDSTRGMSSGLYTPSGFTGRGHVRTGTTPRRGNWRLPIFFERESNGSVIPAACSFAMSTLASESSRYAATTSSSSTRTGLSTVHKSSCTQRSLVNNQQLVNICSPISKPGNNWSTVGQQ